MKIPDNLKQLIEKEFQEKGITKEQIKKYLLKNVSESIRKDYIYYELSERVK